MTYQSTINEINYATEGHMIDDITKCVVSNVNNEDLHISHHCNIDHHNIDNYEIIIRSIVDDTFEISAIIATRIYKKIIDVNFYNSVECPPIIKLYKSMMRQLLEKYINSGTRYSSFFTLDYELHQIKIKFVVDLHYIKENIILNLYEYTQESFEQKIDNKVITIEEQLIERITYFQPKTYILSEVKYEREEDEWMSNFKWDIAHQIERNRFIDLSKKYLINWGKTYNGTLMPITKIEPLCLTVSANMAHLYGWIDITDNMQQITIPKETGIYEYIPRVLQHFTNVNISTHRIITQRGCGPHPCIDSKDFAEGHLILEQNNLRITGNIIEHFQRGFNCICVIHPTNCSCKNDLLYPKYLYDPSVVSSNKKYIVVNTHFLI